MTHPAALSMLARAMPLRIPIGISDFRKLREQGAEYVDKSHLIVEILDRAIEGDVESLEGQLGAFVKSDSLGFHGRDP